MHSGLILNLLFQFRASMESHHATRLDWNRLTGTRIASRTRGFGAYLKVAKAGNFDIDSINQAGCNQVEKRINHVFGFALVQADLLKQQIGQLRFGKCRGFQALNRKIHALIPAIRALLRRAATSPLETFGR